MPQTVGPTAKRKVFPAEKDVSPTHLLYLLSSGFVVLLI